MDFKEFLKSKGISDEDFEKKTPADIAGLHNEWNSGRFKTLQEAVDKAATPEQVKEAKDALETFKTENEETLKGFVKTEDLDTIKQELKDAQEEITSLKENGTPGGNSTDGILKAIQDNKDQIQRSIDTKGYQSDFVVKANVTRASVVNSTDSMRLTDIGQLAYRRFVMRDLFPTVPVGIDNRGVVRYTDWDEATKVRAAAMIAEGGVFPESTAVWQEYTLDLKKIGDTIPVTEEMLNDHARFARELEEFLSVNVSIVEDDQLYSGDGTGTNLNGITSRAEAFTAVASGITDASIYDLLIKVSENIARGKRSKYQPNFVLMNIVDINRMILKKDTDNNYIRPPFSEGEAIRVGNLQVIESNAVTPNTMLVGDRNFAKIYEVEGYNVSTGMINDQFTRDLMTMKAKKRMNLLVREADVSGFNLVSDVDAALVLLAT